MRAQKAKVGIDEKINIQRYDILFTESLKQQGEIFFLICNQETSNLHIEN